MIRIMADSVSLDALEQVPGAALVATYANGKYAVPLATVQARFPGRVGPRINIDGDPNYGDCLDVERFDATPGSIPAWAQARRRFGITNLSVYCGQGTLAQVLAVNAGVDLYHWVATLDGSLVIPGFPPTRGPAAVQAINAQAAGLNIDISLVFEDGWYRSQ